MKLAALLVFECMLIFRASSITLAAMADMAGLDEEEQGVVATVLLASYVVTPLMAFSVSGIITAIVSLTCNLLGMKALQLID